MACVEYHGVRCLARCRPYAECLAAGLFAASEERALHRPSGLRLASVPAGSGVMALTVRQLGAATSGEAHEWKSADGDGTVSWDVAAGTEGCCMRFIENGIRQNP